MVCRVADCGGFVSCCELVGCVRVCVIVMIMLYLCSVQFVVLNGAVQSREICASMTSNDDQYADAVACCVS